MRHLLRRAFRPWLCASVLAFGAGRPLAAQDSPLVVEGRGGVTIPVSSFRTGPDRGGEIGRAPTFGVHLVYRGSDGWGPYLGFSQHRFDCADDGCPSEAYVLTTWDVGMQRTLGGFGWVGVALLSGRLERDFPPGPGSGEVSPVHGTSSLSLGAEAGAGLRIPLGERLGVSPGVRYGWLDTRFGDDDPTRMRWLAVDVGLVVGF